MTNVHYSHILTEESVAPRHQEWEEGGDTPKDDRGEKVDHGGGKVEHARTHETETRIAFKTVYKGRI